MALQRLTDEQSRQVADFHHRVKNKIAYVSTVDPPHGPSGRSLVRIAEGLGLSEEDMESVMVDGLIEAVQGHDPTQCQLDYYCGQLMASALWKEIKHRQAACRSEPPSMAEITNDVGVSEEDDEYADRHERVQRMLDKVEAECGYTTRRLVSMYYGLDGEPMSIAEIAASGTFAFGQCGVSVRLGQAFEVMKSVTE